MIDALINLLFFMLVLVLLAAGGPLLDEYGFWPVGAALAVWLLATLTHF